MAAMLSVFVSFERSSDGNMVYTNTSMLNIPPSAGCKDS